MHGNLVAREDNYGSTLSRRPNQQLLMGGARPEFFLDGRLLQGPLAKDGVLTLRVPGLRKAGPASSAPSSADGSWVVGR